MEDTTSEYFFKVYALGEINLGRICKENASAHYLIISTRLNGDTNALLGIRQDILERCAQDKTIVANEHISPAWGFPDIDHTHSKSHMCLLGGSTRYGFRFRPVPREDMTLAIRQLQTAITESINKNKPKLKVNVKTTTLDIEPDIPF